MMMSDDESDRMREALKRLGIENRLLKGDREDWKRAREHLETEVHSLKMEKMVQEQNMEEHANKFHEMAAKQQYYLNMLQEKTRELEEKEGTVKILETQLNEKNTLIKTMEKSSKETATQMAKEMEALNKRLINMEEKAETVPEPVHPVQRQQPAPNTSVLQYKGKLTATNRKLIVSGSDGTVSFYDVKTSSMEFLSKIKVGSKSIGASIFGPTVYVLSDGIVKVIDVTDINNPTAGPKTQGAVFGKSVTGLLVTATHYYVASREGLRILSVPSGKSKTVPVLMSRSKEVNLTDLKMHESLLYAASGEIIVVFDVVDVKQPTVVRRLDLGCPFSGFAIVGGNAFVCTASSLKTIDATTGKLLMEQKPSSVIDVDVKNNTVYFMQSDKGGYSIKNTKLTTE